MNILLIYGDSSYTLGKYYKKALTRHHNVISAGPTNIDKSDHDIITKGQFINVVKLLNKLPKKDSPDLILQIDSPFWFFLKGLSKVSAKTALYSGDFIFKTSSYKNYAKLFDYVFVGLASFMPLLYKNKIYNSFYLPLACDTNIYKYKKLTKTIDVGFVGLTNSTHNPKRTYEINEIKKKFKFQSSSNTYGQKMIDFYSHCKIVINPSATKGPNMRTFEAIASGALLMQSSNASDTSLHFNEGEDFINYYSTQDASKKIDYYLKHNNLLRQIALPASRKVIKEHNYNLRAQELINIISSHPSKTRLKDSRKIFLDSVKYGQSTNFLVFLKKQIDSFHYKWSFPYWYCLLFWQKIKKSS